MYLVYTVFVIVLLVFQYYTQLVSTILVVAMEEEDTNEFHSLFEIYHDIPSVTYTDSWGHYINNSNHHLPMEVPRTRGCIGGAVPGVPGPLHPRQWMNSHTIGSKDLGYNVRGSQGVPGSGGACRGHIVHHLASTHTICKPPC